MDSEKVLAELTEEQKEKIAGIDAILSDPENQAKLKAMTSADEVIAFYAEKGFPLTEKEKQEALAFTEKMAALKADGELSEAELEAAAGGWSLSGFLSGALGGVFGGAVAGGSLAALATVSTAGAVAFGPVGWAALGCGLAAAGIGGLVGGFDE